MHLLETLKSILSFVENFGFYHTWKKKCHPDTTLIDYLLISHLNLLRTDLQDDAASSLLLLIYFFISRIVTSGPSHSLSVKSCYQC